jgi:multidrug efflux pump subunit AcrB
VNISAPFIQRPIATALLMVGLLAGGLVAYPLLPVAALPNVNYPTLSVTAQLPGADPQTMAETVASPLELQFGQIPGLTQMTSASALGYVQITLQFEMSRQIDGTVSDTLSAIQAATAYLPKNLPYPPQIRKVNPADTPILVLGITSDILPLTVVDAYAQNILLEKLSQISGVGLVGIGGEQRPRPGRSAGPGRSRHQPRGCARGARPSQCRSAERHAQQPAPDLYPQYQRSAVQARPIR